MKPAADHNIHRARRPLSYWLSMGLFGLFSVGILGFFWAGGFFTSRQPPPAVAPEGETRARQVDARAIVVRDIELHGQDEKGQPFVLRAARSERRETEKGVVRFHDVRGEMRRRDGTVQTLRAREALHDEAQGKLTLLGDVELETPGRWKLRGARLVIDLKTRDITSNDKVVVELRGGGRVEARGMRTLQGHRVIRFAGPVRSRFAISTRTDAEPRKDARNE